MIKVGDLVTPRNYLFNDEDASYKALGIVVKEDSNIHQHRQWFSVYWFVRRRTSHLWGEKELKKAEKHID